MTKDELLKYLHEHLYFSVKERARWDYLEKIITQHFSISEQEREEVIKWAHNGLEHEMRRDEPCEDTVGIFKIILKALGGKLK